MTTHSSILAWKIPWTEEPGGLYRPWGCKELDMTDVTQHAYPQQKKLPHLPPFTKWLAATPGSSTVPGEEAKTIVIQLRGHSRQLEEEHAQGPE